VTTDPVREAAWKLLAEMADSSEVEGCLLCGRDTTDLRGRGHRSDCPTSVLRDALEREAEETYCARCHMTESMHHLPNIHTGRVDARGHPYPIPCGSFGALRAALADPPAPFLFEIRCGHLYRPGDPPYPIPCGSFGALRAPPPDQGAKP
jgi:hypothetical protein